MDIQIHQLESKNLDEILELQAKSLKTTSSHYNQRQIESLIQSQKAARLAFNETLFVADYQGKLVGFAALQSNKPEIGGLFVHPDYMRQGIGTKLIETIENQALAEKYTKLYVLSSLAAVDFYQTRSYKMICKSGFISEWDTWIPCLLLEKSLLTNTEIENTIYQITGLIGWILNDFFNNKSSFITS
ncbi:MAG TPA: GNAT family N-acetyltransferase [Nostocaceae cyanobacterium]|nr:GNAT family N-acetyltransferase [Nostocaceae cyanobacterium]